MIYAKPLGLSRDSIHVSLDLDLKRKTQRLHDRNRKDWTQAAFVETALIGCLILWLQLIRMKSEGISPYLHVSETGEYRINLPCRL